MRLIPVDQGSLQHDQIADPAAGAIVSFTTPAHERWLIHNFRFTLSTDANAATRLVRVSVFHAADSYRSWGCSMGHVASTIWTYFAEAGLGTSNVNFYPYAGFAISPRLLVPALTNIQITCALIQAGDQFQNIFINYERWIQP